MAKSRLNQDEAFKSIMGVSFENEAQKREKKNAKKTATKPNKKKAKKAKADGKGKKEQPKEQPKEKLIQVSFYITTRQHKALKLKSVLSGKPEDKDNSSIARTALNIYLADTLKAL